MACDVLAMEPPTVECSLTERGKRLQPILIEQHQWERELMGWILGVWLHAFLDVGR